MWYHVINTGDLQTVYEGPDGDAAFAAHQAETYLVASQSPGVARQLATIGAEHLQRELPIPEKYRLSN